MVMLRRGRWKLIHTPTDPDQLFDLEADPLELVNRAEEEVEVVRELREEVQAALGSRGDRAGRAGEPAGSARRLRCAPARRRVPVGLPARATRVPAVHAEHHGCRGARRAVPLSAASGRVRAAVCRSFGAPLEIEELSLTAPGAGEVRVRIAACAICHSDIAFAEGAWGGVLPAVYGHEAAGVVEETGPDVTGVEPGDRVVVSLVRSCGRCYFCEREEWHLCELELPRDGEGRLRTGAGEAIHQAMNTGAFAEEVVVHGSQVAPIPASLPFDVASLLGCGVLTGLGAALDRASVTRGSTVVVVGTGGVGLNVVQGAAIAAAEQIIAVDLSPTKREVATHSGRPTPSTRPRWTRSRPSTR